MSIVLEKLRFSNMFSYGADNEISLSTNKISQLSAPNGTGKTSISLIIQELLFNKNVKSIKKTDIINKYSDAKEWSASIDFRVGEDKYVVSVTRKNASSKVSLYKNSVDISEHKIPDTYKKINEIIGRDFEVFSQLTYQSSTNLLEFLKATDANRKKFLINLFGLTRYLELGDVLKLKLSEKEKELAQKNGELITIKSFLDSNQLPEKQYEINVPEIDSSLYEQLKTFENDLNTQQSRCNAIDKNNLYIQERDSLVFDISLKKPEKDIQLFSRLEDCQAEIKDTARQLGVLNKQLKNLDISDSCYACGQPIDNSKSKSMSDDIRRNIKLLENSEISLKEELKKLQTYKTEFENKVREFNENSKAVDRFTQLSQLIDTQLPKEHLDYADIENKVKSLRVEIADQEDKHNKAVKHNESVRVRNAKIDALIEQIRNFKVRQQLVENDILEIQDKINSLVILKKAFSTSGIVAYKIESVAKQLEDSINHYLSVLSDGQFQIIFRLNAEKLNIVVVNNGKEVSIDSLSGGEFSRVQTSVLLAVRNTLSKIGGQDINLLFLDEITGVLDDTGKERLFEVLQEEENLNVFLISHDYSHPLIPRIEITKQDNISCITA